MTPPDISRGAGEVVLIEGGLVVPPPRGDLSRRAKRAGVLRPDGGLVPQSLTWRNRSVLHEAPLMPDPGEVADLAGTWVFMGVLFDHFGHFLTESVARLWALDHLKVPIDGLLFVTVLNKDPGRAAARARPLLRALGVDAEARGVDRPLRVARLYVPPQGMGLFGMIEGSPEFRAFARRAVGQAAEAAGAGRIYVSRAEVPLSQGNILGERVLQERLLAEGYSIYHPQKHPIRDQVAAYKAATHIVSVDGSPLHLVAMAAHPGQKVAVIARRAGSRDEEYARQVRAFSGADAWAFDHVRRSWVDGGADPWSDKGWGEVDLAALGASLKASGFVRGEGRWPSLSSDEVRREVEGVGAARGTVLTPIASAAKPAERG